MITDFLKETYPLEQRTTKFGERIIDLCQKTTKNIITVPLIDQLIRSGTSIGANYREANGASSKMDFRNKIFICKKEAKETAHWLQLLARSNKEAIEDCRQLWKEADELSKIFSSIGGSFKR